VLGALAGRGTGRPPSWQGFFGLFFNYDQAYASPLASRIKLAHVYRFHERRDVRLTHCGLFGLDRINAVTQGQFHDQSGVEPSS
jgi:hypothetical protein